MNPYFGTDLYKFIFEQLDEINMQFLKDVVRNDINSQESRITIKSITITKESDNVLNLAIIFSLKNSDLEDAIYYTALLT